MCYKIVTKTFIYIKKNIAEFVNTISTVKITSLIIFMMSLDELGRIGYNRIIFECRVLPMLHILFKSSMRVVY